MTGVGWAEFVAGVAAGVGLGELLIVELRRSCWIGQVHDWRLLTEFDFRLRPWLAEHATHECARCMKVGWREDDSWSGPDGLDWGDDEKERDEHHEVER